MNKPVFDENGVMDDSFIKLGTAGRMLGEMTGKSRPYLGQAVMNLWRRYGKTLYRTPLGMLVRSEDVPEIAKMLGWWRRDLVTGYAGSYPGCTGSRYRVTARGEHPKSIKCPVCQRTFVARWVETSNGTFCTVPEHKRPENLQRPVNAVKP